MYPSQTAHIEKANDSQRSYTIQITKTNQYSVDAVNLTVEHTNNRQTEVTCQNRRRHRSY